MHWQYDNSQRLETVVCGQRVAITSYEKKNRIWKTIHSQRAIFNRLLIVQSDRYLAQPNYIIASSSNNISNFIHQLFSQKNSIKTFCAFIYFQKAFDLVWRIGQENKVLICNTDSKCSSVTYIFYKGVKGKMYVPHLICSTGVRQEEIDVLVFIVLKWSGSLSSDE